MNDGAITDARLAEAGKAITLATTRHPTLGALGFGLSVTDSWSRQSVATGIAFLRTCHRSRLPRMGSLALQRRAEQWGASHGFSSCVAVGELIAAAIFLGFVVEPHRGSPHATINCVSAWAVAR